MAVDHSVAVNVHLLDHMLDAGLVSPFVDLVLDELSEVSDRDLALGGLISELVTHGQPDLVAQTALIEVVLLHEHLQPVTDLSQGQEWVVI